MPNLEQFKLAKDIGHKAITFSVSRVPNTMRVYLGGSDFKVYEADLAAMKVEPKELYAHDTYVTGVALAGKVLVSGGYDGKLIWWDTDAKKIVRTVEAHTKWIRGVFASRDGKTVVSVADDMVARVWDVESGKKRHDLVGHEPFTPTKFKSMLYAAAFSHDGKYIATADKVGKVIVWESESGKRVSDLEAPVMYTWDPVQRLHSIGGIRAVTFSPDGKQIAVGGIGKIGNIDHLEGKARVEVFEWAEKKKVLEFQSDKFQGIVNHLEYAPGGQWLFAAGGAGEGLMMFLDVAGKKAIKQEKASMHIHDAVFNEAADTLIAVGHNKLSIYEMKG